MHFKRVIGTNEVLICKQVDDFQIAAKHRETIDQVISQIGKRFRLIKNEGLMEKFNGANHLQSIQYIKMHCQSYIEKILNNHGWDSPVKDDAKLIEPLHPDSIKELETTPGPQSQTEQQELEDSMGFYY